MTGQFDALMRGMDKTTFTRPISPTGLHWNERGAVCCDRHIPFPGSDTWRWEHWAAMTIEDAEAWRAEYGDLPRCECCGTIADTEPF